MSSVSSALSHELVVASDERDRLPRLLAGVPEGGAGISFQEHLAIHGALPLEHRRRRRHGSQLIDRVERAGLRGRGGASFPAAVKMRAVASSRRRSIVLVNAAEGEPASRKDRTLCELVPHLVLDGAQAAAAAVGADEVIVCVCESALTSFESVAVAIEERGGPSAGPAHVSLSLVPGGYVAGHETALINHLNGGAALPTFTPPAPFQQGVRRRPTLVNNAETLAHMALIARHGSSWFRSIGTTAEPGSVLVTLSGPVLSPGVYEIELGASLSSLIHAAGGTSRPVCAALLGGYAGTWVPGELLRGVALSDEHLAPVGASLGAGVIALLGEDACPVAETVRVARWLAEHSAGQCGPCVNGLPALAATLAEIAAGTDQGDATRRLERLSALVRRRGACSHPDGVVRFVLSALEAFAEDFTDHARHGACAACATSEQLPLPRRRPARVRRSTSPGR